MPHVEQELPTLPEHLRLSPDLSGVRVARSSVFCVMFCRSLFVILSFFLWSLCYLPFFDLRLLITPLVFQIFFFPVYSNIFFVSLMTNGIDLELVFTKFDTQYKCQKAYKTFQNFWVSNSRFPKFVNLFFKTYVVLIILYNNAVHVATIVDKNVPQLLFIHQLNVKRYNESALIKTYISNLVRTTRCWNNLHQIR